MDGMDNIIKNGISANESMQSNTVADRSTLQLSDAIDRLLANPELLSTVASAIGVSKENKDKSDSVAESAQKTSQEKSEASAIPQKMPEMMATLSPVLSALSDKGKLPDDDRSRLLCALKPYVNPHRREAIDTIVQLSKISEVFKTVR